MAYSSYSSNNPPTNSRRINIEPDEDRSTDFDREETQLDTQGNIVSIVPDTPLTFNETGQIKFRRNIYSPVAFKQKVDTNFSELDIQSNIDIPTFFNQYNRLFFDIPKQGVNSHETLINESLAYFSDYDDPKDNQISVLQAEVDRLTQELALASLAISEAEAAQIDTIQYGDLNDITLNWSLPLSQNGLEARVKQLANNENLLEATIGEGFETNARNNFDNTYNSYRPSLVRDATQAFNKGGNSGIRKEQVERTISEWEADFTRRSSGKETRDLKRILKAIQVFVAEDINN